MWFFVAGILGMTSVIAGAFGAHGLEKHLTPHQLDVWKTAASYQMVHALLLAAISLPGANLAGRCAFAARIFTVLGVLLFSGSLYLYAITGIATFAMITPLGGVAMIVAWLLAAIAGLTAARTARAPAS
ncbi:MAG: DUF423 domain-containing protein [Planctomycetes bacterium]|nr:DUF423 domain-containing protein [Planctomycetota bacterium]